VVETNEFDAALDQLRATGLVIFSSDCERQSFQVYRPVSIPGNRREGFTKNMIHSLGNYPTDEPEVDVLDAPSCCVLHEKNTDNWTLQVWNWTPGPGPGDFRKQYQTLQEIIEAILEYYFGDPAWMCDEYNKHRR
jgi:hypothetical protein